MLNIQHHYPLEHCSTFHLPAHAAYYAKLTDATDLPLLTQQAEFNPRTVLWLGSGSNILFMQDYPALVVHMATRGIREISRSDKHVYIEAQAGEIWHDFVQKTLTMGLSGLENLSLIPGTVGASPVQNIGAYGVEVQDYIAQVNCFDTHTKQWVTLKHDECQFAYRNSIFKHQYKRRLVIVSVVFRLDTTFTPKIHYGDLAHVLAQNISNRTARAQDVAQAVCQIRRSKLPDPKHIGNVGSFYHNPIVSSEQAMQLLARFPEMPHYPQDDGSVKLAAGWLIEQCSLKGFVLGGAAVHNKQALVLVNQNRASAQDVQQLSDYICAQVAQKFGVLLSPEPSWLPDFSESFQAA